jgi:hypothetical protein
MGTGQLLAVPRLSLCSGTTIDLSLLSFLINSFGISTAVVDVSAESARETITRLAEMTDRATEVARSR